jgi:hypothetical protein
MLKWSRSPKKKKNKSSIGLFRIGELQKWPPYVVILVCLHNSHEINSLIMDAGTFLTLGRRRGDLKTLWTMGEPERHCPHIQFQPPGSQQ